jgi:GxxExxY protein
MKYAEITQEVIGCAMKVHSYFGMGFPELIYQRALVIELAKAGLAYGVEIEKDIYYYENFIGKRRLDIIVENKILLELKAVSELDEACYNKIINYLKVFDLEVGLLLNFGTRTLQFKRFVNRSVKSNISV